MKKDEDIIVNPKLEEYISGLFTLKDDIISEMERKSQETGMPIIGNSVGKFLMQITLISRSTSVFELGSGFGYSAYWFAQALGEQGNIICTDYSAGNRDLALDYFRRSGVETEINFITGDSLDVLTSFDAKFDIIFNDIDKEFYPGVIDPAYDSLNPGGLLITDNVLWHGRVVGGDDLPSTGGVRKYNELMSKDSRFLTTVIPIRDGLSVSMKMD